MSLSHRGTKGTNYVFVPVPRKLQGRTNICFCLSVPRDKNRDKIYYYVIY
nr:MAG TPA: hypothetical protein [Caudoviricetes sp.]